MKQYNFSRNRNLVKYCPCGKSNGNGKFAPFEGFEKFGYCHSCDQTFYPENETIVKPFEPVNIPKPIPSFHSIELVEKTILGDRRNNFIEFLKTLFSDAKVNEAVRNYLIGTWDTLTGTTVFWQIDPMEKVHHGKVMMYDPTTGKRSKNADGSAFITSVRSLLKLDDFNLAQCLFGLHLVNENTKAIALVESEKTAVIMSLFKPEYTWLSTGSKGGFKYEFLKAIKQYKIVTFPDKSEYHDWLKKAIELNGFGFNIEVSSFLENSDCPKGTDLADVLIDEFKKEEVVYSEAEAGHIRNEIVYRPESVETPRRGLESKPAAQKCDISREESYRAIQYFVDNDTDTFTVKIKA